MFDWYVKAAAKMAKLSCSMSTYPLEEGVHHMLTVDTQPWAISYHTQLDFDQEVCSDHTFPAFWDSLCHSGSIIELQLEIVNLRREYLLSDSADDRQLRLSCIPLCLA